MVEFANARGWFFPRRRGRGCRSWLSLITEVLAQVMVSGWGGEEPDGNETKSLNLRQR
ncbi:MAG: hypothetical protein KDC80_13260 [Saprospiraceae bacterium]|nr:hypothetical protein [Saprospiraceae bacterium]